MTDDKEPSYMLVGTYESMQVNETWMWLEWKMNVHECGLKYGAFMFIAFFG